MALTLAKPPSFTIVSVPGMGMKPRRSGSLGGAAVSARATPVSSSPMVLRAGRPGAWIAGAGVCATTGATSGVEGTGAGRGAGLGGCAACSTASRRA